MSFRRQILGIPILVLATTVGGMLCRHAFSADRLAMDAMVAVTFQGRNVEGAAVEWNSEEVHLLGRDGRLWQFDPREAVHFRKTADHFRPYSPSEFRAALLRELGGEYEVTGTGHYLIAHPRGQQDRWAERFENLDRAFVHYFSVRGLQPATPLFPMVGIVCKDRAEFDRRMTASRATHSPAGERVFYRSGVEGYYRIDTNRLHLYDMGGNPNSATWHTNAAVLIHEATHQTAFNTGVHSRFSPPPRWLAEGLAMLFEAPGVCDPRNHPEPADRVNRGRLDAFRKMLARHRPEMLAAIVADDELFRVAPDAAYAEAWAITFFLAENEPAKYVRYLKRTASHPAFAPYTKAERMADFTAIFGADWRMLEARLLRCLNGLP